jgi:anti-sigma factor RsiW
MNANDELRIKKLLQQALPPVEDNPEPGRDLWPVVLRRMDARPVAPPWFDWALVAGLAAFAAFFPASIPVFLYYL